MRDYSEYTKLNQTVTFSNGKEFALYSKATKRGTRYFYFSPSQWRMFPISKIEAGIL